MAATLPSYADSSTPYSTALGNGVGGAVGTELSRPFNAGTPPVYAPRFYDSAPQLETSYVPNYVAPPAPPPPPSPIYTDVDSGSYCRQYSEAVRIGNRIEESYGTACLQPDGSWRVVQ